MGVQGGGARQESWGPGEGGGRRRGGGACGAGEGGAPVGRARVTGGRGGGSSPRGAARGLRVPRLGAAGGDASFSRSRAGDTVGRRRHEQHQERASAGAEPQAGPQPGGRARAVRQDAGERGRGQGGQGGQGERASGGGGGGAGPSVGSALRGRLRVPRPGRRR